MKTLWAPWRMDYVTEGERFKKSCIFDASPDKRSEKKHLLVYRDRLVVVLLNRFPYANGHLLAAPARHIGDICDLTEDEACAIMRIIRQSVIILRKHLNPDGFNIGLNLGETAGAGIANHLHYHIVPRWDGDHNFMAVLADVKTVPQHIKKTFDTLLPDFNAL